MKWILMASELARKVRMQMRFGELSRAPLKLSRLELRDEYAECEWFARANDPWDEDLPEEMQEQNRTFQTLNDAIAVREMLFATIPQIQSATLSVYRATVWDARELIMTGCVSREDEPPPRLSSLVMRAKLYGFQFRLEDRGLISLDRNPGNFDFAIETRSEHS